MFTESPSDDCKNKQFPQCGGKLVDSYWLCGASDIDSVILVKYRSDTLLFTLDNTVTIMLNHEDVCMNAF